MSKPSVVRLLPEHRDMILTIQAVEAEKSPLGVKPSIGAIASALIQRGIDDLFHDYVGNKAAPTKLIDSGD